MDIYIRPLRESDALVSWSWRNDPQVWAFTGSKPDCYISEEIELNWIRRVLQEKSSKRFAICVAENNEYIGNVQLTHIEDDTAQFHIFIGNKLYWGKGVSTSATKQILSVARESLELKTIYLEVNKNNLAAIKSYEKNGFKVGSSCGEVLKMTVDLKNESAKQ